MPKKGYGPETGLTYLKHYKIGGVEGGGYLHKERAKEYLEAQKEKRIAARTANVPIPSQAGTALPGVAPILTTPPAPGTVPPVPAPPIPDTAIPSWWINQAITNPSDADQAFANAANAILPTLAPEDQRTLASYLATNFKDVYGGYGNANFGSAPTEITDTLRQQYLNPQRAQLALSLLDKMKTASGGQNMGSGYDFLKNAVNLINQFAVDGTLTRERYGQFTNAVSSLVSGAGKGLSAYANLAQLFNLPSFSAGPLVSNAANKSLYS